MWLLVAAATALTTSLSIAAVLLHSALGVFLLWSLTLQLLLALQQLVTSRRLKLAKLGIDSLLLTTNNTGKVTVASVTHVGYRSHADVALFSPVWQATNLGL